MGLLLPSPVSSRCAISYEERSQEGRLQTSSGEGVAQRELSDIKGSGWGLRCVLCAAAVGRWLCSEKSPMRGTPWGCGGCVFQELTLHHNLVKGTCEVHQGGLQGRGLLSPFPEEQKETDWRAPIYLLRDEPQKSRHSVLCWLPREVGLVLPGPGGQKMFYV